MTKRFVRSIQSERGFNLVKGSLLLAVAIVLAAIALDLAIFIARVNKAQWEADGMALAAAKQLRQSPDQEAALRAGKDWAYRNEIDPARVECCTFGDLRPAGAADGFVDTVTAASRVSHSTFILGLLGLPKSVSVRRTATARVVGAGGGPLCPFGVIGDVSGPASDGSYLGLVPGRVYALDLGASPQGTGDFLPLDLAQSGTAGYQEAIAQGCRSEEVGVWSVGDLAGFIPDGDGISGVTLQALSEHYNYEVADGMADYLNFGWCDVDFQFDEEGPGVGHAVGYSPHSQLPRTECVRGTLDGGAGRIVIVPIVSRPPDDPGGAVRILGLASMYIVSWDRGDLSAAGGVYGMFLDRAQVDAIDLVGEDDNPLAPLRVVLVD